MPAGDRDPLLVAAEGISGQLDDVGTKVDGLINSTDQQTKALSRSRTIEILLGIVSALVVIALALCGVALVQLRSQNRCLRFVVAASADRTGVLAPLAQARTLADRQFSEALGALVATAVPKPPAKFDPSAFAAAGEAFRAAKAADDAANDAYDKAYAAHPPPPSPENAC